LGSSGVKRGKIINFYMVGTGRKKTGCRRRNVIKEDLVAEERRWVSVVVPWVYILGDAQFI